MVFRDSKGVKRSSFAWDDAPKWPLQRVDHTMWHGYKVTTYFGVFVKTKSTARVSNVYTLIRTCWCVTAHEALDCMRAGVIFLGHAAVLHHEVAHWFVYAIDIA